MMKPSRFPVGAILGFVEGQRPPCSLSPSFMLCLCKLGVLKGSSPLQNNGETGNREDKAPIPPSVCDTSLASLLAKKSLKNSSQFMFLAITQQNRNGIPSQTASVKSLKSLLSFVASKVKGEK